MNTQSGGISPSEQTRNNVWLSIVFCNHKVCGTKVKAEARRAVGQADRQVVAGKIGILKHEKVARMRII